MRRLPGLVWMQISSEDILWQVPKKADLPIPKAHLIENAYYILTPSDKVSSEKLEDYRCFVQSLKALPIVLDYRLHDTVTGTISHLPHIIASCLVNFVKSTDTKEELMKLLAAAVLKILQGLHLLLRSCGSRSA